MFCAFWLGKVLRATTACTFSTSQLPKVVRTWGTFSFVTCKCASRHNGVQFFIYHLARWLRTRRFSEPTFRPSGASKIIGKTQCFATFLPFRSPASSFFWLFLFYHLLSSALLSSAPLSSTLLFSLTLSISAFHLSILSEVWLLNFLRWWNETAEVFKVLYPSLPLPGLPVEGGRNMFERVVFSRFVCNKEDRIVCSLQQWEWVVAG